MGAYGKALQETKDRSERLVREAGKDVDKAIAFARQVNPTLEVIRTSATSARRNGSTSVTNPTV